MDNQEQKPEIDWVDQFAKAIDLPTGDDELEMRRIRRADIREQLAEQEVLIEAQWKARFDDFTKRQAAIPAFHEAGHHIAMTAVSTLHGKDIDVPSLYHGVPAGALPDEAVRDEIAHLVSHYITVGCDFAKIMDLVHKNPTLKSEWERFCMFIRLAQD